MDKRRTYIRKEETGQLRKIMTSEVLPSCFELDIMKYDMLFRRMIEGETEDEKMYVLRE